MGLDYNDLARSCADSVIEFSHSQQVATQLLECIKVILAAARVYKYRVLGSA